MVDVFAYIFVVIAFAAIIAAGVALALVVIFLRSDLLLPHARAVYRGQTLDLKLLGAGGDANHQEASEAAPSIRAPRPAKARHR